MNLNNKGFVSTAAIYTIFVSFLMSSILLLGMYSNANDYNTGENLNNDIVTEIEKANPIISSIDAVIVDLDTDERTEYLSGESTKLNIEVTPVAINDYEIKKYLYSYDNITWNDWLGENAKDAYLYKDSIKETLYIKGVDYKGNESNVVSIDLAIIRRIYCDGYYVDESGLRPTDQGEDCTEPDYEQSTTVTLHRYRYYHFGPNGGCDGAGNCYCATGGNTSEYIIGPSNNPTACTVPWAYARWVYTANCYESVIWSHHLTWGTCRDDINQHETRLATAYKWYKEV